uniref:Sepiapterin reductase n=1 Tax=Mus musculus TaxID=10090 RepID=Q62218_MOUSE|nr:sepiapterin reductase [Mus musculus]
APDWKVSFCSKPSSFWAEVPQSTSAPSDFNFCSLLLNSGSLEVSRAN